MSKDKRKVIIAARANAGAPIVNDYGAYERAEKAAGRVPMTKSAWAEALVQAAKERRRIENLPKTSVPTTGAMAAKDASDIERAALARKAKAAKDKEEGKKVEQAKSTKEAKAPKDANALSVSDVAREAGIEPKVARARLRKDGTRAPDGRWPMVQRGSEEHKRLLALFAPEAPKATKKPDADDEAAIEQEDAMRQEEADDEAEEE